MSNIAVFTCVLRVTNFWCVCNHIFFWNRLSSTIVFSMIGVLVNICFFSVCEGWYSFLSATLDCLSAGLVSFGLTGWMINEYYSFITRNQHESQKTCSHRAPSLVHISWRAPIKVKKSSRGKRNHTIHFLSIQVI